MAEAQKKVRLRMVIEFDEDVPARWTERDVLFRFNESTWCADNLLEDIGMVLAEDEHGQNIGLCLCEARPRIEVVNMEVPK